MHVYTYLALGDSYTIGEGVSIIDSFPYQVVQLLRNQEFDFNAPEIIAKTGWTTNELQAAVNRSTLLSKYDFVTLLIGVNDQYRGRDVLEYKEQFEELLKKAIELANGKKDRVIVVSIPDYSVTPHGHSLDPEKISKEIEVFNSVNKALSIQYKVLYADVTIGSREAANDQSLIAGDGLHPSEKEYRKWAEKTVELIALQLK